MKWDEMEDLPSNHQIGKKIKTSPRLLLTLIKNEEWVEADQLIDLVTCGDEGKAFSLESNVELQGLPDENNYDKVDCMFTQSDSSGQIPLHIAIWKKAPDTLILKLIHSCEKTVMFKTNNNSTPLHFATFYSSSYNIIKTLIRKYPLALEQVNDYGVTPRTYDLRKLDSKTQELLLLSSSSTCSKPPNSSNCFTMTYWMDLFIKESYEKASYQRSCIKERDLQLQKLQRTCSELESELNKSQIANALLQSQLQSLEKQIEEREVLQEKLESLSSSLEKSLAESTRLVSASYVQDDCCYDNITATDRKGNNSFTNGILDEEYVDIISESKNGKKLEKRVTYLEERLSEALSALERFSLSNRSESVVENGWIMTTRADIE